MIEEVIEVEAVEVEEDLMVVVKEEVVTGGTTVTIGEGLDTGEVIAKEKMVQVTVEAATMVLVHQQLDLTAQTVIEVKEAIEVSVTEVTVATEVIAMIEVAAIEIAKGLVVALVNVSAIEEAEMVILILEAVETVVMLVVRVGVVSTRDPKVEDMNGEEDQDHLKENIVEEDIRQTMCLNVIGGMNVNV